MEFQIVVMM